MGLFISYPLYLSSQTKEHTYPIFFWSALSCGHWGWEWALWDNHESLNKQHIFQSVSPEFNPAQLITRHSFFFSMTFPLPSGQGETSSIFLTSRAWWVEPPPPGGVGYPTVSFCYVGRRNQKPKDINGDSLFRWREKNHLHPETKPGKSQWHSRDAYFLFNIRYEYSYTVGNWHGCVRNWVIG